MTEYQEITQEVDVPMHAGVEGFLAALRQVLKQPRVTRMEIDLQGKVTYTRFARPEEPRKHIEVDFDSISPAMMVRNLEVQELDLFSVLDNAAVSVAAMFHAASLEQMFPIAFVTGANTSFLQWHKQTTGVLLLNGSAYGLPVLRDRFIPDDALLLVTAYARSAGLVDARKAYKLTMPSGEKPFRERPLVEVQPHVLLANSSDPFVLAEEPKDREVKVVE